MRIFFAGVMGSKWSNIAQQLEFAINANITDRNESRTYEHSEYSGHQGVYYGHGLEFAPLLDEAHLDAPFRHTNGIKLAKSHDWLNMLDRVYAYAQERGDKLMLVWRDPKESWEWWRQAGGYEISYPTYHSYEMPHDLMIMNSNLLKFTTAHNVIFEEFDSHFIKKHFGVESDIKPVDALVTLL